MAPTAANTTDNLEAIIDLDAEKPFYKRKNGILLYFLLTSAFLSSLASGFDGVSPFTSLSSRILTNDFPVNDQCNATSTTMAK